MIPPSIRTAYDLNAAIALAPGRLYLIGHCPTKERMFTQRFAPNSDDEGLWYKDGPPEVSDPQADMRGRPA